MSRERFPPQEGWDEVAYLKKKGLLEQGDALIGTSSQAEMNWKIVKVAREQNNKQILAAAGWPGFVAQVGMGALSPTMAIPFLRASTGARSIALGAASVLGGAAVQEAVLMANQETRTGGEVAFSLAASTVLGGVLGGIFHTLSKGVVDKIVRDMDAGTMPEYISKPVPFTNESAVGADVIDQVEDVGKLKEGWGAGQLSRAKITQNPIIRGLQQWNAPAILKEAGGSAELRRLTAGFSQDSLTLTGNTDWRAASPGGNVEDLKRTYAVISYDAHKAIEGAYIDYMKTNSGILKLSRAQVAALGDSTKMNYPEFKRQIALDIWTNFTRDNVAPEVRKAAQTLDKDVYKKLYDEGIKAGIFTGEEKVVGDQNYANRMYKHKTIMARHEEFVKILADNYRGNLEKEFTEASAKVRERMMKDRQQLADMQRSTGEIENLKRDLEEEAAAIEETTPLEVTAGAATIKDLRREMVEIKRELETLNKSRSADPAAAVARQSRVDELEAQLRQKALEESIMKEALGEDLGKYTKAVQAIRRRLYNLARANAVVDAKRQKVLSKIEQNEDAQIGTILRARQQLDKFVKFLAKGSDAEIERELSKLKNSFEGYAEKFDKVEEQIVKLEEGDDVLRVAGATDGTPPEQVLGVKRDNLSAKLNEFAERIDDLDSFDRAGWRAEVDQMMRDLADTAAKVNARRVLRNEKLWKRAERLSPEAQAKRVAKVEEKAKRRLPKFNESWRAQGAVDADIMTGKADFTDAADEIAREVTKKILGVDRRLAYSDIIRELRGPELARVLNIPSEKIIDFLEDDVEKMIAVYTRTLGADLSIMQVFKSLDMAEPLSKLDDERQAVLKRLSSATKKDGTPKYTQEQLEKESLKVNQFYDQGRKDVLVLYERARGMRGIPQDPDSWSYRAAKMAMDLNYLRFMGSVVISSIPDISRIVMRHGLVRTMRSAVIPMITNFKTIRISQREAMRAGTALDQVLHTRMYSISDVFDDANRGTAIERGIHLMATRLGTFGLFDQWNAAIKQITAGVVNTRLLDSIAMVMGDVKASAEEIKKATEFLARNNITEDIAQTIWKEVTNGKGGGKVNGIWLPNTEDWNVADPAVAFARRAYRAALGGEVDATIITPGFGRPNWTDANTLGRMLAQFKSFGLVSTQKTLMAGLQEHDAAFFNGVMLSLGLGMVSYFLWAKSVGGKAEEEMYQAIEDGNWEKFADEAIARSGVLGVFSEVQRVAERIPLLRKYANLSGSPSTRRDGGDLTEALLGPSFDLLEKSGNFIAGVDEPTKSTLHQLRLMLPFQNLFYFRRILDAVEDAAPLPERRKKEK
jgi:hypothetical protein